ncbi:MAG: flavin reductase family protein [Sphingomonadales bacterium]
MFYQPSKRDHGLKYDPFKSLVVPRPIGWISTISLEGVVNLAPFSFFNAVCHPPPVVMFCANSDDEDRTRKDSRANAEQTGEFVVNLATWELREQMSRSAAAVAPEVDEFDIAGLTQAPSKFVKPPRVAESPAHLECKYLQTVELPRARPALSNAIVLGEVIGVHISEDVLTGGLVDTTKLKPIARLGYGDYAVIENVFTMTRNK